MMVMTTLYYNKNPVALINELGKRSDAIAAPESWLRLSVCVPRSFETHYD
jgi:hypothetical protein